MLCRGKVGIPQRVHVCYAWGMDDEKMGPCIVCGKPARYQVDPYRDEICDDQTPVPLHDGDCYQEQVWDI
jgi:hypothetical protein